ncbi:hypothetical protein AGMMS50284_6710 [Clostridia bacterium]|nr:hypothetical protein AGMMS50284_6710 [Clostridia bacterium]
MTISRNSQNLIEKFIEYATIEGETKENGDYKLGNKMSKKLNEIFDILKGDNELAEKVLGAVLHSEVASAQSIAAVDALRLNILVKQSIKILEKISKQQSMIAFGSRMALKIYRGEVTSKTL